MLGDLLPRRSPDAAAVRHAAWVARCVGRGDAVPLTAADVHALAAHLQLRTLEPGERLFGPDASSAGVWLVRSGRVELSIGSGRKRAVLALLRPGDVEGDLPLLLGMPTRHRAQAERHRSAARSGMQSTGTAARPCAQEGTSDGNPGRDPTDREEERRMRAIRRRRRTTAAGPPRA